MRVCTRRLVAAAVGVGVTLVLAAAVSAASAAAPTNTKPPSIAGTAKELAVLEGSRGQWSGNPTDYNVWWQRCDRHGHGCANIDGSGGNYKYRLAFADVGHRIVFAVGAANADGRTWAYSSPTDVVAVVRPVNVQPPSISGTPREGETLSGTRGTWTGNPTDYNVWWQRCNRNGGSCANISGTGGRYSYRLGSVDVGTTIRFSVGAANAKGRTWASSAPTAVIAGSQGSPPPSRAGCPAARGGADDIAGISSPARLLLDGLQAPSIVTRQTRTLVLRFHVSSTCGRPVKGALVYVAAIPYNQFSIPAEQTTGGDGWVEVQLPRLGGFPVTPRQQLVALFVRARKTGENPLAGISTRRLFSVRVNLHA